MRWLCIACWGAFLFGYGLSGPLYRTEALRAVIAQEALAGQWFVPTLYGEPFLTKPPGVYVAIASASAFGGHVTEVSARVPSAIVATLLLLFFYRTLRTILGETKAFVATLLLPMSVLWLEKVPSAEIDILQLAWVSAALLCFVRAELLPTTTRQQAGWWLLALVCVAGGFLTKWTAPAFFYLTVGPYLVWQRRTRVLFAWPHLLACSVAIGVCAVWAFSVAQAVGWDVLRDTVGREAAQRFAPKGNGKPYPWLESLTFPFVLLAANLPWSVGALWALRPSFQNTHDERTRHFIRLLHCWAWPNVLFWSLPAQHNVRYVLPIVPAFTLLGVLAATHWLRNVRVEKVRRFVVAAVLCWAVVKVAYVEVVVPQRTAGRDAEATGRTLADLVPADETLYLCKLKDEGILFYYARPARRFVLDEARRPRGYALLLASEYATWQTRTTLVRELRDQQQAPIFLVHFE